MVSDRQSFGKSDPDQNPRRNYQNTILRHYDSVPAGAAEEGGAASEGIPLHGHPGQEVCLRHNRGHYPQLCQLRTFFFSETLYNIKGFDKKRKKFWWNIYLISIERSSCLISSSCS
jgi:hypothetical protein